MISWQRGSGLKCLLAVLFGVSLSACSTSPLDFIPKHELSVLEQQARADQPAENISVQELLAQARGGDTGAPLRRLVLQFEPGKNTPDPEQRSRLEEALRGAELRRGQTLLIVTGPAENAGDVLAAVNAQRRAVALARLIDRNGARIVIRHDPELPPEVVILELPEAIDDRGA